MPEDRQGDFERDQDHDGDLKRLHAVRACLVDEQIINVAYGLQLAADAVLPVAQVKSAAGDFKHSREVVVANELQRVVNPFKEAGGLDFKLADLAYRAVVKPPEKREPPACAFPGESADKRLRVDRPGGHQCGGTPEAGRLRTR